MHREREREREGGGETNSRSSTQAQRAIERDKNTYKQTVADIQRQTR